MVAGCSAKPGRLEDPLHQLREIDSGGLGRHRKEAGVGEAGDRVHLEDLRSLAAEHQVDPGEPAAAERLVGAGGELLHRSGQIIAELSRADVVGPPDLVTGLEVEEVLLPRDRLDDRQGLAVEDADRQLTALHVALEQDPVVVAERPQQRLRNLLPRGRELDPQRGALARRLHHQRETEPRLDLLESVRGAQLAEGGGVERRPVRRGDAGGPHLVLGGDLVHAERTGGHARSGVRQVEDLEELLHGAVLTARPVQRDEDDVRLMIAESGDQVRPDVDAERFVAKGAERVLHSGRGAQRDLALERAPSLEDGDLHLLRIGTTSPPGSSPSSSVDGVTRCSPVMVS